MHKQLADYLHLYIGCQIKFHKTNQELLRINGISSGFTKTLTKAFLHTASMNIDCFKLMLRPLSDMKPEEAIAIAQLEGYRFARHYKSHQLSYVPMFDKARNMTVIVAADGREKYRVGLNVVSGDGIHAYYAHYNTNDVDRDLYAPNQFEITRYLLKCGFDLFGLIKDQLAIEYHNEPH